MVTTEKKITLVALVIILAKLVVMKPQNVLLALELELVNLLVFAQVDIMRTKMEFVPNVIHNVKNVMVMHILVQIVLKEETVKSQIVLVQMVPMKLLMVNVKLVDTDVKLVELASMIVHLALMKLEQVLLLVVV